MSKELVAAKAKLALERKTFAVADRIYQPGDKVLIWREKQIEHQIGEYFGPYTVISYDSITKTVLVQKRPEAKYELYRSAQIKPYVMVESKKISREVIVIDYLRHNHESLVDCRTPTDEIDIRLAEVIQSSDPRTRDLRMAKAIQEEVRDILRCGTFKVIIKEEILDGSNVLTARYVLAIKSKLNEQIKFKARYVIGGHRDMIKHYLVHSAHTL